MIKIGEKPYHRWENADLLDKWARLQRTSKDIYKEMDEIKLILNRRMKDNRATHIPHDKVDVAMGPPTPILERLVALREVVGEEEFNRAFTPAHVEKKEVAVSDKINLTIVKGWAKQGDHVKDIIEYGTDHETATLTLKLK